MPPSTAAPRARTRLSPADERRFQAWYRQWAERSGIDPNPDAPEHNYDYRAAFQAGIKPRLDPQDGRYHWPSKFKGDEHPTRFINGRDTQQTEPEPEDIETEPAPQSTEPGGERPDPGYEGDIGKARRAVEARGLQSGQDGYWTAVFGELRPDLANRRPPPGQRLIPLRQYLAQAMKGQGMPGSLAGHRPGNWGSAPPTEGPESYNDMTRRWQEGMPTVREDQMPLPNWHPGYLGPSDQSIIKVDPLRPPGEFPMPRPLGETVNPPLPLGVGAPTVPSLASIRPEELAALLRQPPQA